MPPETSRLFHYLIIEYIFDSLWLIVVYIDMNPGILAKGYMPTLTLTLTLRTLTQSILCSKLPPPPPPPLDVDEL